MQETWQETPAAIPAPVAMECREVVGGSFEASLEPRSCIEPGLSRGVEGERRPTRRPEVARELGAARGSAR